MRATERLEPNTGGWILTGALLVLMALFAARGALLHGLDRLTSGPSVDAEP